jgi:hypothetical protein
MMTTTTKAPGTPAGFDPIDWNPPGLPTDPDEIMMQLVDPTKRGELYPLYHQLRRVAPVYKNRPEIFTARGCSRASPRPTSSSATNEW